jgi:hypothetical protein
VTEGMPIDTPAFDRTVPASSSRSTASRGEVAPYRPMPEPPVLVVARTTRPCVATPSSCWTRSATPGSWISTIAWTCAGRVQAARLQPADGAQFRVSEDDVGVDVVRALHLDLPGGRCAADRRTEGRVFGVYGGAKRSACQRRIPPRRRPEPALVAVLAAGNSQGTGLVRPRRPGSVPPDVRLVPAQGRPARTPTSARPFEQRFDTRYIPVRRQRRRP